jgi:gamma-glutamylputrescine oxidase
LSGLDADPVWEDGDWSPLPEAAGPLRADVCVVGLGGSGLACVHELLDAGVAVIGVDAGPVAGGAAGRNGGFLLAGCYDFYHDAVRRYGRDATRAIYALTLEQIDRIAAETPEAVRRTGSLRLAADAAEMEDCRAQFAAMRADGLPVEEFEGPEGAGLLIPTDASFNPLQRARLLARRALDRGARLFEHSPAHQISAGRVVTPSAAISCGAVVVAVDGGLSRVLPELSARVRVARLQMLATEPTSEIRIPRPVYARYGFDYWQQLADGRIALGGFRDTEEDAEWTESTTPSASIQARLERQLRDRLHVRARITHRWAASVGFSDDGLPVLEEVRPGVWAAGGYSGTGNVIGALSGRAMARLITDRDDALARPFGVARAAVSLSGVPRDASSSVPTERSRT